jgi:hypothetical protein
MLFGEITCGDDAGLRTEPALPRKGTMDANHSLIPTLIDQNPCAQWRKPMDMMRQGCSTNLFHASQQ